MRRQFMVAKLHRVRVTQADLTYEGSLSVDGDLLAASGILPNEQVQVVNVTTGARFETYAIPAPAGSGTIGLNGGAARLGQPGDLLIVIIYGSLSADEAPRVRPRVVLVDDENRVREIQEKEALLGWPES